MGGCRCSFRNCTIRSDGITHLFHFPVFDKVRCHQWLTNANKLDFLNLKVSQLKNRVVCQHHFKDNMFMNYMKDKLKFDAVPTERGPFCTETSPITEPPPEQALIVPDEIENDQLTLKEKQANYSVKYGDFLINADPELVNMRVLFDDDPEITLKRENQSMQEICDEFKDIKNMSLQDFTEKPSVKKKKLKPKETVTPPIAISDTLNTQKSKCIEINAPFINKTNTNKTDDGKINVKVKKEGRVHIISEKKISEKMTMPDNLEPVPPTLVLRPRNKRKEYEQRMEKKGTRTKPLIKDIFSLSSPNPSSMNVIIEPPKLDSHQINDCVSNMNVIIEQPKIDSHQIKESPCVSDMNVIIEQPKFDSHQIKESPCVSDMNVIIEQPKFDSHQIKESPCVSDMNVIIEQPKIDSNQINESTCVSDINVIIEQPKIDSHQINESNYVTGENTQSFKNYNETKPVLLEPQDLQKDTEVLLQVLPDDIIQNEQSFLPLPKKDFKNKQFSKSTEKKGQDLVTPIEQGKSIKSSSPNKSILKNKIPPERVAVIEEKRKFNKKLRDMFEFCLDEIDDTEKNVQHRKKIEESEKPIVSPRKRSIQKPNDPIVIQNKTEHLNKNIKDSLSQKTKNTQQKDINKSPVQKSQDLKTTDSLITILENRLQKMEDRLLQKIEQNSQKIVELKKCRVPKAEKKSILIQTVGGGDSHKKQLFSEISKYLSPQLCSNVYEELFLNQFSQTKTADIQKPPPKRRRRMR